MHGVAIGTGLMTAALSPAAAQPVQTYGLVTMTVNSIKGAGEHTELRDNASRLGFRGTEDLGGGMGAFFGLEMGIEADTGNVGSPVRNSYVGLRGDFGALALGRLDSGNPTGSPLYSQVAAIVPFAPADAGATAIGTAILNARNRTSNSLGYISPNWHGFDVRARYALRGAPKSPEVENGAKSFDIGFNYTDRNLHAGIGFAKDSRPGGLLADELSSKWQAGLSYAFGPVAPYALIGRDTYKNTATSRRDVDYWIVGAKYSQNAHAVALNLMQRDVQTSLGGKRKRQQLAYFYALSKRTELRAFIDHDGVDSSRRNVAVRAMGGHHCKVISLSK